MKYIAMLNVDNDIIIQGDECVTDLRELYIALTQRDTTEIIIRKEFADKFFTYSALCDFVESASALAPNVIIDVEGEVTDNLSKAVADLAPYTDVDSLIYALETKPSYILQTIHTLRKHFVESHDEHSIANNKMASLLVQITNLERELKECEYKRERLEKENHDLSSKLNVLVARTNFRYEKTINPDKLFIADQNNYNHILYIKEISRVHYVDTFVYYLQEILRTMYGIPMRSVVIEPYYAYDRVYMYDGYKPHWDLAYTDVYSGNIYMAGYQPKVMDAILKNANRVNYMIVLDRGGYIAPHITGKNVTTIYTASDIKDVPREIQDNEVITYEEFTLNIPHIPEFNEISPEDKVQKYSSMPTMKHIIQLLEEEI